MTDIIGWARLSSPDASASQCWPALVPQVSRRGAWYPVMDKVHPESAGPDDDRTMYVLDIGKWRLAIPANILEVREALPDQFSVVIRSPTDLNPARGTPADLGNTYAVCPQTRCRVRLIGHPEKLECPCCGEERSVAWEEAYWTGSVQAAVAATTIPAGFPVPQHRLPRRHIAAYDCPE